MTVKTLIQLVNMPSQKHQNNDIVISISSYYVIDLTTCIIIDDFRVLLTYLYRILPIGYIIMIGMCSANSNNDWSDSSRTNA